MAGLLQPSHSQHMQSCKGRRAAQEYLTGRHKVVGNVGRHSLRVEQVFSEFPSNSFNLRLH